MRKLGQLGLILISIWCLIYIVLGPISWCLVSLHGDYPGPKILSNVAAQKKPAKILLIHGASVDARIWQPVLNNNANIPIVAISLAQHEREPQYADPTHQAAVEINQYLSTHPKVQIIVGHSTAALWFAEAYALQPTYWQKLHIILLSPNIGNNSLNLDKQHPAWITWFIKSKILGYSLPNPYWAFFPIAACAGIDQQTYQSCKNFYLAGRLFRLGSAPYYKKINHYMLDPQRQVEIKNFLQANAARIKIYLASNDHVVKIEPVKKLAQQFSIPCIIISHTTHQTVILQMKQWLFLT